MYVYIYTYMYVCAYICICYKRGKWDLLIFMKILVWTFRNKLNIQTQNIQKRYFWRAQSNIWSPASFFFLHRKLSLTSIVIHLLSTAGGTVLVLLAHLGFPSRKQTIFVGAKLSLSRHGNLFNVIIFVSCFVLRSLFSLLTISLCVWPAGLNYMADDVHAGNLPCVWAGAHKLTLFFWCSYASNSNITWQLS